MRLRAVDGDSEARVHMHTDKHTQNTHACTHRHIHTHRDTHTPMHAHTRTHTQCFSLQLEQRVVPPEGSVLGTEGTAAWEGRPLHRVPQPGLDSAVARGPGHAHCVQVQPLPQLLRPRHPLYSALSRKAHFGKCEILHFNSG